MSMDLRQLGYLVSTVDAGSASQAALRLHVTQPVLSRQLRALERQVGVSLFERRGSRLTLTRAGEEFTAMARELLEDARRVERAVGDLATGRIREIHLAVPATTLADVLAPFIASLTLEDPVPIVRGLDPEGAAAALRSGADLAIVTRPPGAGLTSRHLATLPIWAYVPANDTWASHRATGIRELVARPLVVMAPSFRPRELLDAAVDAAGLSYGPLLECANAQVAQALAASGRGVAVVSDDARFDLVPLQITTPEGSLNIKLYAAWDPRHHAGPVLSRFADRLARFCIARYGEQPT